MTADHHRSLCQWAGILEAELSAKQTDHQRVLLPHLDQPWFHLQGWGLSGTLIAHWQLFQVGSNPTIASQWPLQPWPRRMDTRVGAVSAQ